MKARSFWSALASSRGFGASILSGGMRIAWPFRSRSLGCARLPFTRTSPLRMMRWIWLNDRPGKRASKKRSSRMPSSSGPTVDGLDALSGLSAGWRLGFDFGHGAGIAPAPKALNNALLLALRWLPDRLLPSSWRPVLRTILTVCAVALGVVAVALGAGYVVSLPVTLKLAVPNYDTASRKLFEAAAEQFRAQRQPLRLEIVSASNPATALAAVEQGRADLAVARAEEVLRAKVQTALIVRQEAAVIMAAKNSKVKEVRRHFGSDDAAALPRRLVQRTDTPQLREKKHPKRHHQERAGAADRHRRTARRQRRPPRRRGSRRDSWRCR